MSARPLERRLHEAFSGQRKRKKRGNSLPKDAIQRRALSAAGKWIIAIAVFIVTMDISRAKQEQTVDKEYLLVSEPTGMTAEELGRRVGMRAIDTPLGTMLEKPKPFDMYSALAVIDRALNPNRCRCTGVIHRPDCPAGGGIT